ncbi:MAG TPA: hypothetical protein VFV24_05835, partial [Candidatus Eisenbacteria bacterium]|nr:hypothetical protein [Candidatus Eisenbacteria bacterium]
MRAALAVLVALGVAGVAASALAQPSDSTASIPPAPPPAPQATFQPSEWETLATIPDEARLVPIYNFRYNRVDGPAPTLGLSVRMDRTPAPLVYAQATYAFSRERLLLEGGLEVPLGDPVRVRAGGAAYRRTATED